VTQLSDAVKIYTGLHIQHDPLVQKAIHIPDIIPVVNHDPCIIQVVDGFTITIVPSILKPVINSVLNILHPDFPYPFFSKGGDSLTSRLVGES
jgi:hypothetical protein